MLMVMLGLEWEEMIAILLLVVRVVFVLVKFLVNLFLDDPL